MKYTDGKNIMVYAQSADGAPVGAALETVSKAAELAKANGEEVIAVVFGKDTDTKTVITAGASKVLVAGEEGLQAEEKAQILVKLAEKYQPKAVYMAGTPEGKMIAPAVSAVFESGCVTDVTGITADGVYTSLSYNGNVLNDMKMGENLPHVAAEMADHVMVMYAGKSVEYGTAEDIFDHPMHPYTVGLLKSIPKLGSGQEDHLFTIEGTVPGLDEMPAGCRFSTRCPYATEQCKKEDPGMQGEAGHFVRCFRFMDPEIQDSREVE